MVLVHDDDLVQLDGIRSAGGTASQTLYRVLPWHLIFCIQTLKSLQLGALLSHLRKAILPGTGELVPR